MFNHVFPGKGICVIMSCSEIDMGKSCKIVFSLSFQTVSILGHKSAEPCVGFVLKHEKRKAGFQIVNNTSYNL